MSHLVPVIGMEVHVELNTKSKMFCSCDNDSDHSAANTNVCPICLGHPGTLPVPNKTAIQWTVLIGKALGCQIRTQSKFDRKHYFYPDLAKGYQISQYDEPIAEYGKMILEFPLAENIRETAEIGIRRAHLEEDTAKLFHDPINGTLADFNRSGTPLVEIVTDPDFKTPLEAKTYCQELRTMLRYLGISHADMEKGHMRCEANISVQEAGKFEIVAGVVKPLGDYKLLPKVELKNLNSFKAVEKGIQFEINRQTALFEQGEQWYQETRGWDETKEETVLQRVKENAADYRYFPEPDIPVFSPTLLCENLRLPELPQAKRLRFRDEYGFSYADAKLLTDDRSWSDFAEQVMTELIEWIRCLPELDQLGEDVQTEKRTALAKLTGGWLTSKLMGVLKERAIDIRVLKLSPENFAELITLIYTQKINSTNALKLLIDMVEQGTDVDPNHIMEEKKYGQVNDVDSINLVITETISHYPKQVEEFRAGKEPIIKFLLGMVMKATEGTADPILTEQLLRDALKK